MGNKVLVVGAGFTGAVIARILAESGFYIDVIDQRNHIGGNAFDYVNQHGIRMHKYGAHIFHTSNRRQVEWLSQYTEWVDYKHRVKAQLADGSFVTFPPNVETIETLGMDNLINTLYKPYTEKMWDCDFAAIDSTVIARTIHSDKTDDLFFKDTYQLLPKHGYHQLFERILCHKNISVILEEKFTKEHERFYMHIFNSMCIDEYYDYCYGELPYRSLMFSNVHIPSPRIFPVSVVNFTHRGPAIRAIEWKNFPNHGVNDSWTTITTETPCWAHQNNNERYYPVNDKEGKNRALYKQYANIPNDKTTFVGRCGEYVYIDMHQAVSSATSKAHNFIKGKL